MKAYKYRYLLKNAEGAEGILREIKKTIIILCIISTLPWGGSGRGALFCVTLTN